jgi:hypothetical protein
MGDFNLSLTDVSIEHLPTSGAVLSAEASELTSKLKDFKLSHEILGSLVGIYSHISLNNKNPGYALAAMLMLMSMKSATGSMTPVQFQESVELYRKYAGTPNDDITKALMDASILRYVKFIERNLPLGL